MVLSIELHAHYCLRSNLPLLNICDHAPDMKCFWHYATLSIGDSQSTTRVAIADTLISKNMHACMAHTQGTGSRPNKVARLRLVGYWFYQHPSEIYSNNLRGLLGSSWLPNTATTMIWSCFVHHVF